jgi:hypothetical protein
MVFKAMEKICHIDSIHYLLKEDLLDDRLIRVGDVVQWII